MTTSKDFTKYKKYIKKWMRKLNLTDWTVTFAHEDTTDDDDDGTPDEFITCVLYSLEHKSARFYLAQDWGEGIPCTDKVLDMCAFHECMHIVLAFLTSLTRQAKLSLMFEHHVIAALEKAFFPAGVQNPSNSL